MNAKDARIKKLWERGVRKPHVIAQKLGYGGREVENGVVRVLEGLKRLGIDPTKP